MPDKKVIRVTCESTDLIDPSKLIPFQGEIKWLEEKQFRKLAESIFRHGFSFPEFAWKKNGKALTIDGHQRTRVVLELLKNGWTDDAGQHSSVELAGGKVPVVYIKAKDEKAAKELVLAAMSQYGKYDEDSLYEFIHEANLEWPELKGFVDWPAIDMNRLEVGWFKDEDPKADEVPETPKKAITKPGDLWELGDHRLLCEDCTAIDLPLDNALFTDPPYGINRDPSWLNDVGKKRQSLSSSDVLKGDDGSIDFSFLWRFKKRFIWGFPYLYDIGATGWIVWDKQPGCDGRGIVTPIEMASTTMRTGFDIVRCMWGGFYREKGEERFAHPTQKPIKVVEPFMEAWTKERDDILDPFLGSGTTMIAAEKLKRRCYGIEIESKYVDVAVLRWMEFTGKDAKLEATGQTFSKVAASRAKG